ncbi:hypothetical protein BN1221_04070 [Brenneria goodwinii]|uniref:Uncharacterized protein n=1 Tax=Brenneria goodwinii TaxID=1109412 RepID=A0A0G4K054_9GAMM|nr:hypothetical protein BN1221_04070 [Brenneria goodwinii]
MILFTNKGCQQVSKKSKVNLLFLSLTQSLFLSNLNAVFLLLLIDL